MVNGGLSALLNVTFMRHRGSRSRAISCPHVRLMTFNSSNCWLGIYSGSSHTRERDGQWRLNGSCSPHRAWNYTFQRWESCVAERHTVSFRANPYICLLEVCLLWLCAISIETNFGWNSEISNSFLKHTWTFSWILCMVWNHHIA